MCNFRYTESRYFRKKLISWFSINARDFPWRYTSDPYDILVAEIMLQQTGADKVSPVFFEFMSKYPTIEILSKARHSSVLKIIASLGLAYRAKTLISMAKEITITYGGIVPSTIQELLSIKGVGKYTANAVLCFAYGKRTAIVDTNVIRLYTRFFGMDSVTNSNPPEWFEEFCLSMLPRNNIKRFNYALLDFPAVVCKHYNPKCTECPLKAKCSFYRNEIS